MEAVFVYGLVLLCASYAAVALAPRAVKRGALTRLLRCSPPPWLARRIARGIDALDQGGCGGCGGGPAKAGPQRIKFALTPGRKAEETGTRKVPPCSLRH